MVTKHIKDFWGRYNIVFPYSIEHKLEHLSLKTAYFAKSYYALKTYNQKDNKWNKLVFKIRGQKEFFEGIRNPYFITFENLLNNKNHVSENIEYRHFTILSIPTWRIKWNADKTFPFRPGDVYVSERGLRLNHKHMPFDYLDGYKSTQKRFENKDFDHYIQLAKTDFQEMHRQMLKDNVMVNEKNNKRRMKKEEKNNKKSV